jgi:hypothetical protein
MLNDPRDASWAPPIGPAPPPSSRRPSACSTTGVLRDEVLGKRRRLIRQFLDEQTARVVGSNRRIRGLPLSRVGRDFTFLVMRYCLRKFDLASIHWALLTVALMTVVAGPVFISVGYPMAWWTYYLIARNEPVYNFVWHYAGTAIAVFVCKALFTHFSNAKHRKAWPLENGAQVVRARSPQRGSRSPDRRTWRAE